MRNVRLPLTLSYQAGSMKVAHKLRCLHTHLISAVAQALAMDQHYVSPYIYLYLMFVLTYVMLIELVNHEYITCVGTATPVTATWCVVVPKLGYVRWVC